MVVCDFVIVAIDQKRPKKINIGGIDVYSTNRNSLIAPKQYAGGLFILQALRGIWYLFYPQNEQLYTNGFCDFGESNQFGKNTIHVRECWVETIAKIVEFHVMNSPHQLVGLMFRLDTTDKEIVHSPRCLSDFLADLKADRLQFNELYFVDGYRISID